MSSTSISSSSCPRLELELVHAAHSKRPCHHAHPSYTPSLQSRTSSSAVAVRESLPSPAFRSTSETVPPCPLKLHTVSSVPRIILCCELCVRVGHALSFAALKRRCHRLL